MCEECIIKEIKTFTNAKCHNCGIEFALQYPNQKFCSIECRKKYTLKKRRIKYEFDKANPKPDVIECLYCGTEFKVHGSQKFCSPKCRAKYRNLKRNKTGVLRTRIIEQNIPIRYCEECGKEIPLNHRQASIYKFKRFCSRKCCGENFKKNNSSFTGVQRKMGDFKVIFIKEQNKYVWKAQKNDKIVLKSDVNFDTIDLALKDAKLAFY